MVLIKNIKFNIMREGINILLIYIIFCIISTQTNAQSFDYLDINNVSARINANSYLFNDPNNSIPSYEYPKNSGIHSIFSARLMLLGLDINSQLFGNVPQINNSTDLFAGPIMNPLDYSAGAPVWDKVWKINCSDIQEFIDFYNCMINPGCDEAVNFPGYQIPQSILNWPAHGDVSKGQDWLIAPFFDRDGDNFYDPNSGDYPRIKGDQAIFFIYNDERPNWSVASVRMEIRGMAYAFNNPSDSALNNTIFLNYQLINRSNIALHDTYIGFETDMDVGNYSDDLIGSDVERSAYYTYNGDAFDEDGNGMLGYGSNLTAQAVVFLSGQFLDDDGVDNPITTIIQDVIDSNGTPYEGLGLGYGDGIVDNEKMGMENFMQYVSTAPQGGSGIGVDFYNIMQGKWADGTPLTYGGSGYGGAVSCKYAFPGNSDPLAYGTGGAPQSSWFGSVSGDKKGIGSIGPFTLNPGEVNFIDIALVSARDYTGSGSLASIGIMEARIDSIRSYFLNGYPSSNCGFGGLPNEIKSSLMRKFNIKVGPNPFNNEFAIDYDPIAIGLENNSATLTIYNLIGEKITSQTITQKTTVIDLSNQSNGIYFVTITDGENRISRKVIKQ
jgi:hypothetical protein